MNTQTKKILLIVLAVLLAAEAAFVGVMHVRAANEPDPTDPPATTVPTAEPTEESTEAPTETVPETDPPETTVPETEPQEQRYVLTFTGDCTLGSTSAKWNAASSFVQTIGENYDYPFANLVEYFEDDDFTMINLEGVLADSGTAAQKTFAFRGPTAYTAIMTGSSVEAVTLANNHTLDFGQTGYQSTVTALEESGIAYVEKDKTTLYTTESGLVIGLYACSFDFSTSAMKTNISKLRSAGAEIVVCAFHWGTEGAYRPSSAQQSYAHAAIDAGADIVYGNHPHVLQKIEEYGDGIIYYSLGNCSFGGSGSPQDYDAAILQQEVIRDTDGSVRLGELTIIPISVSSVSGKNNYQPIPLEEGSKAYERAMSKLDGTFTGADLVVDYSKLDGNSSGTTSGTTSGDSGTTSGDSGSSGGTSSGGSSDAGSSGSDAGSSGGSDAGSSSGGDVGSSSGGDAGSGSADAGSGEG